MKKWLLVAATVAAGFSLVRCSGSSSGGGGGGGGAVTQPHLSGVAYSTTSNVGDYAEWAFSGNTLSAYWYLVDTSGSVTGVISASANCSAEDATYGYRTCTISSSSCYSGSCAGSLPPNGDTFKTLEVPNIALFVKTGSGATGQLHMGLLRDNSGCSTSLAGDYVFMSTNVGSRDLFGMFRADTSFANITHSDFGFSSAAQTTTPTVTYNTSDGSGSGQVSATQSSCDSGVRNISIAGAISARLMGTSSGLFILDLASGSGGRVAFKTTNAAVASDIANKNFKGLAFPDNGAEIPFAMTTGAVSGGNIAISSVNLSGGGSLATSPVFKPLTASSSASTATSPSYPNFNSAVTGYSANSLQSTYANPAALPGMFYIDGGYGVDSGRVIVSFMRSGGKVIGIGTVYNYRSAGNTITVGSQGTYTQSGIYNTGNFLVFEK